MSTELTSIAEQNKIRNACIEGLLLKISNGDSEAIGELYDLIKTDVFAFALSKLASKSDAEDVTQDTFVQIYKYATQYKPKGKPMAWIITIELNLIRRFIQLKSRSVSIETSQINEQEQDDFEQRIVNDAFLNDLMQTLNEEEREIIILYVVSGLKHREIAQILEKPLATVLSKYSRALKKLKEIAKEVR